MKARVFKNIRLISLLLAVTLLNAHMIIPHDHHQSETNSCQQDSFPSSKQERSHHSGFPLHCHAFNDLTSEKAINLVILKLIQFHDHIPASIIDTALSNIQFSRIRVYNAFKEPLDSGILELSSLRAPPSTC
jgi:hypothetical protein